MITHKGDITTVTEGIVVHGCNAQGRMGSGVAKAVRATWPQAYDVYRRTYVDEGLETGDIPYVFITPKLMVVNAITQNYYGYGGKRYLSYRALKSAMFNINYIAKKLGGFKQLHFPLIGAGLAGGDWNKIEKIIEDTVTELELNLWVL